MAKEPDKVPSDQASIGSEEDLESIFPDPSRVFSSYKVEAITSPNVAVAFDTNALLLLYKISQDDL